MATCSGEAQRVPLQSFYFIDTQSKGTSHYIAMDEGAPRRKPVSLRRRSFGSQNGVGIWWRKQSVPVSLEAEETDDATGVTSDGNSTCSSRSNVSPTGTKAASPSLDNTTEENAVIGWDDDLCRPIYYHRMVSSGNTDLVDDTDGEEEFDVLNDTIPTTASEIGSVEDDGDEKAEIDDAFRVPTTTRKRTKTFGNRGKRQRPVSLILTEDNTDPDDDEEAAPDRGPRRISLSPTTTSTVKSNNPDSNSDMATPETTIKPRGNRRSTKKQRTDDEELEKARDYFANLDETQALTLDAAISPTVSSRITRTSRKTDLKSPRINRSYQAYSESIRSDGLSPLSIKDYASSRRLHFLNKGEIVDGFLDD